MSESAESGTTGKEILEDNGVGQTDGYRGTGYTGSKTAKKAIDELINEFVDQERIISPRSIANAVDVDVRPQEIGKTLGAYLKGDTPGDWFDEVEVSMWRDTSPKKWRFVRVAGEVDRRRSQHLQKPQLVRELSAATGAEGARYRTATRDRGSWEKASVTLAWMQDIIEAICERTDYVPSEVADDPERDRRDWVDDLTQAGTTQVLRRAAGIDDPGADTSWNRETLQALHDVLVAGHDPSEVSV
ncbi:hypothetical protein [Halorubrum tebenquichense]|uniref:Uncharacterized protein n=1 Tax=Halorubrum tebenquichense DSM 14210 TaxID=1227485 RepID=M0DMM6_9EURY|nr:hypothetical protein [Halorubrum tebenquichense]ELZ35404.1 hypothetical protein C472_12740 [Halorubrum tebenquichense DSM 14210]